MISLLFVLQININLSDLFFESTKTKPHSVRTPGQKWADYLRIQGINTEFEFDAAQRDLDQDGLDD